MSDTAGPCPTCGTFEGCERIASALERIADALERAAGDESARMVADANGNPCHATYEEPDE